MKKIVISLLMVITLLLNILPAGALNEPNEYPESQHNYSSNCFISWTYTAENKTDCMLVTFSEDTYFGPGGEDCRLEFKSLYKSETIKNPEVFREYSCDYLVIKSDTNNFRESFCADELAGKTILVPGNKFQIILRTNESDEYYGFKIDEIDDSGNIGDYIAVTYKIDENTKEKQFFKLDEEGQFPVSDNLKNRIVNDKAIIGWEDNEGHRFLYSNKGGYDPEKTNVFGLKPGDEIVLTPIYTSVAITPEEVFSFANDYDPFENGYKMTKAHAKQMKNSYISATKGTPFSVLGVAFGLALSTVYQIIPWAGSCCGFPIAALMQHYGLIDMRSEQKVSSVSEIIPDKNTVSAINFYNAVTPAAMLCANKAGTPGSKEYKEQINKLYETVASGKPAVCFIWCDYVKYLSPGKTFGLIPSLIFGNAFANTHCILLTGAYTDSDGRKTFLGYDENYNTYYQGEPQVYTISQDGGDITDVDYWYPESLGGIAWLSDVSCLESFKADGENNPKAWYDYYSANKDVL